MYAFNDQWGRHEHELSVPGRPFDATKSLTCQGCISRLDSTMNRWLKVLDKRYNLPDGFWDGYKFSWNKG